MRIKSKKKKYDYRAFLWLAPALLLVLVFSAYPVVNSMILALTDANSTGHGAFIGLANFVELFQDPVFWICMGNVLLFTAVGLFCGNLMTIMLAELLFNLRNKKLGAWFRIFFIIPILVPFIVIILVWRYIVFSSGGFANSLLSAMGMAPLDWYFGVNSAKWAIIMTNFPWVAGTSFLIYLAGLQGIGKEVIEASKIDGCRTFRRVFSIDLPLIKGQLKYFLIMGIIGGLQNFDLQLLITGSGVGTTNNVNVLGYYLYEQAFLTDGTRFGYASAVGVIIFIITMAFTIFNFRKNKKEAE